jgi:hypothetical protein
MFSSMDFLRHLGQILVKIFMDSYIVEPILLQFNKSKSFLKSVMLLISSHNELLLISQSIKQNQETASIYTRII